MRYVVANRTITPADIPTPDVRDSYAENCTFTGDFAGYDFRNVSLFNCTMAGDFSAVQHQYLTSVGCDWSNAILPSGVSSYKHDMVIGVLKQALSRLSPQRRAAVQNVIDNVGLDYYRSWPDSLRRLAVELSLTRTQIRNFLIDAFDGYPTLLRRLQHEATNTDWDAYIVPTSPGGGTVIETGNGVVDLAVDPRMTEDRWANERLLETPGVRIHLWTMHPYPTGISKVEDTMWPEQKLQWDWWAKYRGWED